MKKILLLGLSFLFLLGLASCDNDREINDNNPPQTSEDDNTPEDPSDPDTPTDPVVPDDPEIPVEDFTIKTSDNGLSVAEDSYSFSVAEEGDNYPPDFKIRLTTDSSWDWCTGLNDDYTRIVAEDETVLPEGAIAMDIVTNSDLVGSSGSNEIAGIDLIFDRELVNVGTSKLKLEVKPSNGSSSINKLTTICINIEVLPFGGIIVDTYNIDVEVDLTGLAEIIAENSENVTSITLSLVDDAMEDEVYGYSADYIKQVDIPLAETYTTASITDFKMAVGHRYLLQVFVEGEETSDRIWIYFKDSGNGEGYEFEYEDKQSYLNVTEDNITVNAEISEYRVL